uniref:Uncharacterized protein n=1 Tax=Glossina pallidipes TaxID=7398 RepID=A0A1B0AEY9_GLOPL
MDNLKRKIRNSPCKLFPVATTTQIAICSSIAAICDTSFSAIYFAQSTQAQLSFKITNLIIYDELSSLHNSDRLIQTLVSWISELLNAQIRESSCVPLIHSEQE